MTSPSKDAERTRHCLAFYYPRDLGTVYKFPSHKAKGGEATTEKILEMTSTGYSYRVTSHLAESFLSYVIIFYLATHFAKWVEREAEAILLSLPVLIDKTIQEKKSVKAI